LCSLSWTWLVRPKPCCDCRFQTPLYFIHLTHNFLTYIMYPPYQTCHFDPHIRPTCLVLALLSYSNSLQWKIQKQAKWMNHWGIDQDSGENIAGEQQGVAPKGGHLGSKGWCKGVDEAEMGIGE
jgi:hypothetical protein